MGLRRRTAVEPMQALLEPSAPGPRRVTEPPAGLDQLGEGDQPTIEQLLEDRDVIERREVDREVEGQPARLGDDDPVRSSPPVARPSGRESGGT